MEIYVEVVEAGCQKSELTRTFVTFLKQPFDIKSLAVKSLQLLPQAVCSKTFEQYLITGNIKIIENKGR